MASTNSRAVLASTMVKYWANVGRGLVRRAKSCSCPSMIFNVSTRILRANASRNSTGAGARRANSSVR